MAPSPDCDEKGRLIRKYVIARADYNRAVAVLEQFAGVMLKEQYEKTKRFAETTRHLAEETRLALGRHTAKHGC